MKNKALCTFVLTILLFITSVTATATQVLNTNLKSEPSLNLTVATGQQICGLGEEVYIYGNLTLNGSPVQDGRVALQVIDPQANPIYHSYTLRCVPTDTVPIGQWSVSVAWVYPCDAMGEPKYSFKRGTLGYLMMAISNSEDEDRDAIITYTLYDSENVPHICWWESNSFPPGTTQKMISMPIPSEASLGEATVYANAYTELPENDGTAYYNEKSANFIVTSTALMGTTHLEEASQQSTYIEGSYNSTFRLIKGGRIGTYTIHVTSNYTGQHATDTITFQVILIGDVDGNKKINMRDVGLACLAYGSSEGEPGWNPDADVYPHEVGGDGKINMRDIGVICLHYGETAI